MQQLWMYHFLPWDCDVNIKILIISGSCNFILEKKNLIEYEMLIIQASGR